MLTEHELVLFNDTILENVLNGLRVEDLERLGAETKRKLAIDACILANVHEFVLKLPVGCYTRVGGKADTLSGGQK